MLEFDLVKIFRRFFNTKDEITSKLNQKSNVNHSHGNINNEGKLASANGILVTDDDKNIKTVELTKEKLMEMQTKDVKEIEIFIFLYTENRYEIK